MNAKLLKELDIDENAGPKGRLDGLESKQFEYLERLETVSDENRREEIESTLSEIDKEIEEVKKEIKTIKNGIVLDQEVAHGGSGDLVREKVEAFKAKEADKQAKEAERLQKSAEKATGDAQNNGASENAQDTLSGNDMSQNTVSSDKPQLTNALVNYKKGDYTTALEEFRKLAEADDETAQYVLANMYNRGEGTQQNTERAEFWMKRSADRGNHSAQLDYGIMKLANNNNDPSIIAEGLKYLEMAGDQDDHQAMERYIEAARSGICGRRICEKAMYYCTKLTNDTTDSYDKERYNSVRSELEIIDKNEIALEGKRKRSTVFTVIGSVMFMIGWLYLLGGIHPILWKTNLFLRIFPDAPGFLLLPIKPVWNILAPIMDQNGMFGLELILFGEMFAFAGDYSLKTKLVIWMRRAGKIACVAIAIWHFVGLIIEGRSFFTALGWYIIVIAIAIIIGRILGAIFGAIFRSK